MEVNPYHETYGEIYDLQDSTLRDRELELLKKVDEKGGLIAVSHDKDALLVLQDQLRKAGYKKAR